VPARRASILVVADETLISDLIVDVLCEHRFEVHAVPDAEAALRYVESGSEVDVLFTDINLPGDMDGSTLAERMRERRPELPIVYCSGRYLPSALRTQVPRLLFVRKPYVPADLCTLLERLTATMHRRRIRLLPACPKLPQELLQLLARNAAVRYCSMQFR
jgi:CheY-like chemotaxis protein